MLAYQYVPPTVDGSARSLSSGRGPATELQLSESPDANQKRLNA